MIREAIQFHGGRMERNSQQLVMTEKSKYGMEFPVMKLSRLKLIHGFLKQFIIHTVIGWLRQGRQLRLWDTNREVFYESSDHSSTIADLGWSPDGSGVAVAAYNGVTLHVPHKQKQPRKYSWKGSSLVLAWSPDARYIATGEQDSTVHFWHRASGEDDRMYGFPTKVLELSWNSTGRWLATGGSSSVILWDCSGKGPAGRKPREYLAHSNKLTQVAFQPTGELLASKGKDAVLAKWDPMKHDKIIGRKILSAPASSLRWNKDANLAIGQEDGRVAIFKLKS